jgi:copper oxidase (laccase) domain-containing protein
MTTADDESIGQFQFIRLFLDLFGQRLPDLFLVMQTRDCTSQPIKRPVKIKLSRVLSRQVESYGCNQLIFLGPNCCCCQLDLLISWRRLISFACFRLAGRC